MSTAAEREAAAVWLAEMHKELAEETREEIARIEAEEFEKHSALCRKYL